MAGVGHGCRLLYSQGAWLHIHASGLYSHVKPSIVSCCKCLSYLLFTFQLEDLVTTLMAAKQGTEDIVALTTGDEAELPGLSVVIRTPYYLLFFRCCFMHTILLL